MTGIGPVPVKVPRVRDRAAATEKVPAAHIERADPGLDGSLRPVSVPYNALPDVRQDLFGILRDEGVGLGSWRGRQHPARPVPGNLGQRIINSFRLTQGDDVCIVLHGVSFLPEILAGCDTRHDTPPRNARKLMVWMPPPEGITMCQVSS
jgi:hypothetical protein